VKRKHGVLDQGSLPNAAADHPKLRGSQSNGLDSNMHQAIAPIQQPRQMMPMSRSFSPKPQSMTKAAPVPDPVDEPRPSRCTLGLMEHEALAQQKHEAVMEKGKSPESGKQSQKLLKIFYRP